MVLADAIRAALEGKAILFAGSGFSHGAKNWKGDMLPMGTGLRDGLAKECGIEHSNANLSAVSDYYLSVDGHSPDSLITYLKEIFTLGDMTDAHREIMSLNWKRVYTTNYDLVIEESAKANGQIIKSITLDAPFDLHSGERICVHINGSISNLTRSTLKSSFKLTDQSYDAETLAGKPWFDFMDRDFTSAKAIIIVGFSMQNDIDIRRIIARPQICSKVVFISGPNPDPIDMSVLKQYAPVETIGIEGFAEKISSEKKVFIPSVSKSYDYSSFVHEHMTPLEKCKTKFDDLTGFYYLGNISPAILQKNWNGEYENLVLRNAVDTFMRERFRYKVFLAISNIGNGKALLCNLLRNELRETDVDVFTFYRESVDLNDEIEFICNEYSKRQIVVIIDDYYKHLNILRSFSDFSDLSRVTFMLTSRLSKLSTNYRKLIQILHINEADVKPLRLNDLTQNEINQLANVLWNRQMLNDTLPSGAVQEVADFIREDCKSSIGNVVIKLFDSSYIKNQLIALYEKAVQNDSPALRELAVASLASEVMNLHLSSDEIIDLLGVDFVKLSLTESELICELFDAESDEIKVRSSIVARKILQDVIPIDTLLPVLKKILLAANKRYNSEPTYAETMKAIVSHTNFKFWIRKAENVKSIKEFYDDLRTISFFSSKNPFYWEQFASVCIDAKDFPTAHQCLNNAFEEANRIQNFVPFQVETVYARYLLANLSYQLSISDIASENIVQILMDADRRLFKYYNHPEDDHYHVFQLFNSIIEIFFNNLNQLSSRDTSMFLEKMVQGRRRLTQYQKESESMYFPSTKMWLDNLDKAIDAAKAHIKETS